MRSRRWTVRLAVATCLVGLVAASNAVACSLAPFSKEFTARRASSDDAERLPAGIVVESVQFVPWLSDAGSCDGVGWLRIALATERRGRHRVHDYGYLIRAVSGVNDPSLFPPHPLSVGRRGPLKHSLFWGWTGITPDGDGHVRWRLELVPVARSGAVGAAIPLCVSSDDSCRDAEARGDAVGASPSDVDAETPP